MLYQLNFSLFYQIKITDWTFLLVVTVMKAPILFHHLLETLFFCDDLWKNFALIAWFVNGITFSFFLFSQVSNLLLDMSIYLKLLASWQKAIVPSTWCMTTFTCTQLDLLFCYLFAGLLIFLYYIHDFDGSFDSTFFKDFHRDLARIVKLFLSKAGSSEAFFLSPNRGDSLDMFLEIVGECGLRFSVTEKYDTEVWKRHERFMSGEDKDSWPSYEKDHCYPLLIRITLWTFRIHFFGSDALPVTFFIFPFLLDLCLTRFKCKSFPFRHEICSLDLGSHH